MINLGMEGPPSSASAAAAAAASTSGGTAERAFSFLYKGWREVRDSAGADFQLMRARANSFKSLADRELENFLHSASSPFALPPSATSSSSSSSSSPSSSYSSIAELEFVKRIQPKLSEIQRTYSSRDFSRKVLEKWRPKATIRIDLSAIRNAIVSEVDEFGAVLDVDRQRAGSRRKVNWKEIRKEGEEGQGKDWDPVRMLRTGLKEFERKSQSYDIFGNFNNSEFVEKVKLSLVRSSVPSISAV